MRILYNEIVCDVKRCSIEGGLIDYPCISSMPANVDNDNVHNFLAQFFFLMKHHIFGATFGAKLQSIWAHPYMVRWIR